MSWLCPGIGSHKAVYPYIVYDEFTFIDPNNKQFKRQTIKHQPGKYHQKYQGWERTKVRAKNYKQMLHNQRSSGRNFQDPQFLHVNANIGSQYSQNKIQWVRVIDLVENPVYAHQQTLDSLQKFKCSNRPLQNALLLMARIQLQKFVSLLTKNLIEEGIYQFNFFINGIIENVIIDDYVPAYKNMPLFVGPAHETEVYPMLLQKGLAKAFGSYENIPNGTQQLLEVLLGGAARKINIVQLRDKNQNQLQRVIFQAVESKASILLQSNSDPKIRNYGINPNELYQVINYHQVQLNARDINLYEMVSENKLSAWNGNFSINDPVWMKLDPSHRNKIFKDLKNNKSFCMAQSDISRIFNNILIFQNTFSTNKDWMDSVSKKNSPSLIEFGLKRRDKVFIRVSTPDNIRQTLIIAQKIGTQQFKYLKGYMKNNSTICQVSLQLQQGNYVICILHDWILKPAGYYSVFFSSSQPAQLSTLDETIHSNFLEKILIDFSYRHYKQKESQIHAQNNLYSVFVLGNQIGLAFLHIKTHRMQKESITLLVDQRYILNKVRKLQSENWQVMEPFAGKQSIIVNRDEDKIVIVKANHARVDHKVHFPSTAFKIKS